MERPLCQHDKNIEEAQPDDGAASES